MPSPFLTPAPPQTRRGEAVGPSALAVGVAGEAGGSWTDAPGTDLTGPKLWGAEPAGPDRGRPRHLP